jgi:N6-L-threonylcarbamoyladenine synthase
MKILGIESSCDDSSVSVVENGNKVLSSVISSQTEIHEKTGGVVPEVAAREHLSHILGALDKALSDAKVSMDEIDAVAVTQGPGLISSLIIGTETANVISFAKEKPLIPVHHIHGHIYANWLETEDDISFPILILTVSGGHNELILMKGHGDFELIGESLDDAAGEAFDKVSRILSMGYPGGPKIYEASLKGNASAYNFPRAMLSKDSLDFSFSGLKTAVLNEYIKYIRENNIQDESKVPEDFKNDVAASFQFAVNSVLSDKLLLALEKHPEVKEVHLAGGVSANLALRKMINLKIPKDKKFRFPKKIQYCTDNASMIACAAYYSFMKNPENFKPCTNIIPSSDFGF